MTIKFNELIKIREILTKLSTKNFTVKTSYPIAKFLRNTDGDASFYIDKMNELIEKYRNSAAESKTQIQILPEKIDDFNRELSELENHTIEVEPLLLNVEVIPDTEITPEEMYWLIPVLA